MSQLPAAAPLTGDTRELLTYDRTTGAAGAPVRPSQIALGPPFTGPGKTQYFVETDAADAFATAVYDDFVAGYEGLIPLSGTVTWPGGDPGTFESTRIGQGRREYTVTHTDSGLFATGHYGPDESAVDIALLAQTGALASADAAREAQAAADASRAEAAASEAAALDHRGVALAAALAADDGVPSYQDRAALPVLPSGELARVIIGGETWIGSDQGNRLLYSAAVSREIARLGAGLSLRVARQVDARQGVIRDVPVGSAAFTRVAASYGRDAATGRLREHAADEPRFVRASGELALTLRHSVSNLLPAGSGDFATGWAAQDAASVTVTPGQNMPELGVPDGLAYLIESVGGNGLLKYLSPLVAVGAASHRASLFVAVDAGSIDAQIGSAIGESAVVLPGEARRVDLGVLQAGQAAIEIGAADGAQVGALRLRVAFAMIEQGSEASDPVAAGAQVSRDSLVQALPALPLGDWTLAMKLRTVDVPGFADNLAVNIGGGAGPLLRYFESRTAAGIRVAGPDGVAAAEQAPITDPRSAALVVIQKRQSGYTVYRGGALLLSGVLGGHLAQGALAAPQIEIPFGGAGGGELHHLTLVEGIISPEAAALL